MALDFDEVGRIFAKAHQNTPMRVRGALKARQEIGDRALAQALPDLEPEFARLLKGVHRMTARVLMFVVSDKPVILRMKTLAPDVIGLVQTQRNLCRAVEARWDRLPPGPTRSQFKRETLIVIIQGLDTVLSCLRSEFRDSGQVTVRSQFFSGIEELGPQLFALMAGDDNLVRFADVMNPALEHLMTHIKIAKVSRTIVSDSPPSLN